jgi:hypothetical protein
MNNPVEPKKIPHARLEQRSIQSFLVITAHRVGGDGLATVEISVDDWFDLPPVRQALQDELKRRKMSRRSLNRLVHGKGCSIAIPASTGVPGGHTERRGEEDWVVVNAFDEEHKQPVTIEMTLPQWLEFWPVQWVIEDELERRDEAKDFWGYRQIPDCYW